MDVRFASSVTPTQAAWRPPPNKQKKRLAIKQPPATTQVRAMARLQTKPPIRAIAAVAKHIFTG
jgi:hypothetical protein